MGGIKDTACAELAVEFVTSAGGSSRLAWPIFARMIRNRAGLAIKTVRQIRQTAFLYGALLSAMLLVIACGGNSADSPLPTFASPPTVTPVVVQDAIPATLSTAPADDPLPTATAGSVASATSDSGVPTVQAVTVIAPTPEFAAPAVTANFVPDSVKLGVGDDLQTVRITASGIDPRANGYQVHLLHPENIEIESISCVGLFDGGFALGPAPLDDGALIGCAVLGVIGETAGEVVELVLKRKSAGEAEISIRESSHEGDAFFSEFVWPGDEPGQQAILADGVLTVTE